MCFFFLWFRFSPLSFSLSCPPSPPFSSFLLCVLVGVGPLDQEGDTRLSALHKLSHSTSLKRGGSLRTARPSSKRHSATIRPESHSYCAFVCLCHILRHALRFGESQYLRVTQHHFWVSLHISPDCKSKRTATTLLCLEVKCIFQ